MWSRWAHSCAIQGAAGELLCWGRNQYGQLGVDSTTNAGGSISTTSMADAQVAVGITDVAMVSCGMYHTCVLTNGGAIKCWGLGTFGRLGYDNTDNIGSGIISMPPADVNVGGTAAAVSAGSFHTCALSSGGYVKCWGCALPLARTPGVPLGLAHACAPPPKQTIRMASSGRIHKRTRATDSAPR